MSPLKEFHISPNTPSSHEDDVVIVPSDWSAELLKWIVWENFEEEEIKSFLTEENWKYDSLAYSKSTSKSNLPSTSGRLSRNKSWSKLD